VKRSVWPVIASGGAKPPTAGPDTVFEQAGDKRQCSPDLTDRSGFSCRRVARVRRPFGVDAGCLFEEFLLKTL